MPKNISVNANLDPSDMDRSLRNHVIGFFESVNYDVNSARSALLSSSAWAPQQDQAVDLPNFRNDTGGQESHGGQKSCAPLQTNNNW